MSNANEELGIPVTHVELVRDRTIPFRKAANTSSYVSILHEMLDHSPVEQFITIYLNDIFVIGVERTALGQNHSVAVSMPEVFRGAILAGADSIVVGHCHNNDNPEPSDPDIDMTDVLMRSSVLMGIPLRDHIIVSPNGTHYSMVEHRFDLESRIVDMAFKNAFTKLAWDMKPYHKGPGGIDPNKNVDDILGGKKSFPFGPDFLKNYGAK